MASFARSLEVPYTPQQMFALVEDIESYPEFLPWCVASTTDRTHGEQVYATLKLARGPLRYSFATYNKHDKSNCRIEVRLARGPLKTLQGLWRFIPVNEHCKIEFEISYAFSNRVLEHLLDPLFALVYERMVDAFAARADNVYGQSAK